MHQNSVFIGYLELFKQLPQIEVGRTLIDHQPHRTIRGMGADVDDGADEAFILHAGHGDKNFAVEKTSPLTRAFLPRPVHGYKLGAKRRKSQAGNCTHDNVRRTLASKHNRNLFLANRIEL